MKYIAALGLCLSVLVVSVASGNEVDTSIDPAEEDVLIFTVASEETEGYKRYQRSAQHHGLTVKTLGLGQQWKGGDMSYPGGGYKVNLLKEALEPYKATDRLVLFTDSYDVMFLGAMKDILGRFLKFDAGVVFGAEHYCWPDATLREKYPVVLGTGARFLNSGMFMGFASDLYKVLTVATVEDTEDDQLYYTKIYLDEELREKLRLKLDHRSEIFQNLHGAEREVKLDFADDNGEAFLRNLDYQTTPMVVHGNGPSKVILNGFGNYLAAAFVRGECKVCGEGRLALPVDEAEWPTVTLAVFVERPTPFFEEFLDSVVGLVYPKKKIDLFVHNNVKFHEAQTDYLVEKFGGEYNSAKLIRVEDSQNEAAARLTAAKHANELGTDYMLAVDAEGRLDNAEALKELIKLNKDVVAPLLTRPKDAWSNFWGALNDQGYYARSHNYLDIVNEKIRGIWNVPFVTTVYLAKKHVLPHMRFVHEAMDTDMALCHHLRAKNIFMHVANELNWGHLINSDTFNPKLTNPDFYQLFANQLDWEQRYIHPDYHKLLAPNVTFDQPCPDVYRFPVATTAFCDDMVGIMEAFGKWSDGSNSDKRLEGGYEAVPTRDIHTNQVGLEPMWLKFLQLYVRPLQEAVYTGYFHDPPRSLMNFMVRYRPDEQPSLRPHHDSSTYTINIAMNTKETDYTGGGCRFTRYNCSVLDTQKGWMLMHPGRLTHFHEGLTTLSGTRYIMISFVDP